MTSRYNFFAVLCLTALALQLHAQSDMDERKVRFGLFASPNMGWLSPNIPSLEKDGLQSKLGFGYGAMMDYKFSESPNYLFSTGFNITSCGGGLIEPWDTMVYETQDTFHFLGRLDRMHRLQYMHVPLLLKMRTNEIGYMCYFGAIGLDLGFRTRARGNNNYHWIGDVGPQDEEDIDISDRINFLKLALNITLGAEYNLSGNTNVYVGLGWHNSFTNVFRNTNANRILEADDDGNPKLEAGQVIPSEQKKAVANYISLDLGIFF